MSLREVMYPLMQGYDSVALKADVELGGSDQWFNLLAGREMQRFYKQEPQDIITNPLINGVDGRKMSSSWGNTINLTAEPKDMFGKVMSMQDEMIITYFEHCTETPMEQVREYEKQLKSGEISPRDLKDILAFEITELYWGEGGAQEGRDYFDKVIREKSVPEDITEITVGSKNIVDVLVESKMAKSKSDARRLIEQKGVKVNGNVVNSAEENVEDGAVIQKGARHFTKVIHS